MRVLILGSGGREHALAWGFARDTAVSAVHVAPGNGGTAQLGTNHAWDGQDFERVHELVSDRSIDLIVPGSEEPLVNGLYDFCLERGLPAVGPSARGAQLEGSKAFGKQFCLDFHIPTATARTFDDPDKAWSYIRDLDAPPVLKADGLAAGKGVLLPDSKQAAQEAVAALMVDKRFGKAGNSIIIEERLYGFEASLMCASDGTTLTPIAYGMDYKRAGEQDAGPNTGGMGVLSPHPRLDRELLEAIAAEVTARTATGLTEMSLDYRGILYIGLMLTNTGPQVIEFNCRWGDPETQGMVPRLKTPLSALYTAMRAGTLADLPLEVDDSCRVGVVLASQGYPGSYARGVEIDALQQLDEAPDVTLFHAATTHREGHLVTSGGRVACVVGAGEDFRDARNAAYAALSQIALPGLFWRRDIGTTHVPPA